LYQATARPHFCAKSIAKEVLPAPARPLIIVEVPVPMLFSSILSKRVLETRHVLAGGVILSVMNSSFAMAKS